jgi:hypothetical protein
MNSTLLKAINVKNMLWLKIKKDRSQVHWESYRAQRNYVTKLRKQSMNSYLSVAVSGGIGHFTYQIILQSIFMIKTHEMNA